jgi:hypothetical protein
MVNCFFVAPFGLASIVTSATLGTESDEGEENMSSINSRCGRIIKEQPSSESKKQPIRDRNPAGEAAKNKSSEIQKDAIKALATDGLDKGTRPAPPDANLENSPAGPLKALGEVKNAIRCFSTGIPSPVADAPPVSEQKSTNTPRLKEPEIASKGGKESNPYLRLFFLDKPSTKGGIVMQRIKWSEQQPDGSWKHIKTYYEAFEVKPGKDTARPGDTFSAKRGEKIRIQAEATFYEGMTLNYLMSQGFARFGVKEAGNLYAKAVKTPDGRMTFDRYEGSNTMKDVWECRADQRGKCQ